MLDLNKELSVYKPTLLSLAFLFICIALWLAILLTTGKRRDKIRQDYMMIENAVQILRKFNSSWESGYRCLSNHGLFMHCIGKFKPSHWLVNAYKILCVRQRKKHLNLLMS